MSKCKYYDQENGWCMKFSYWSDPMPEMEFCHKGPCPHEEKLTNYDLIKGLSLNDMAVFITTLLREEDERLLGKLEEQGYDVSLIALNPETQLKIHTEYLEKEVE